MSVPGWGESGMERTSTTTTLLHHNNYNKCTNLVSRDLSHPCLRSERRGGRENLGTRLQKYKIAGSTQFEKLDQSNIKKRGTLH